MDLWYNLIPGMVILMALFLFFFFKSGLLWLFGLFRPTVWILDCIFYFCEEWHWNFDGDCIYSLDHFRSQPFS